MDGAGGRTRRPFQLAARRLQTIPDAKVPVQYSGQAGAVTDLTCNSGAGLSFGMLKPVSQLGSSELEDGRLKKNSDGSLTIWLAPQLPAGVPATNWIPTPSTAYYDGLYGAGSGISTQLQVILRSYYPSPGNEPPSMLPYTIGTPMAQTYIPPAVVPAP